MPVHHVEVGLALFVPFVGQHPSRQKYVAHYGLFTAEGGFTLDGVIASVGGQLPLGVLRNLDNHVLFRICLRNVPLLGQKATEIPFGKGTNLVIAVGKDTVRQLPVVAGQCLAYQCREDHASFTGYFVVLGGGDGLLGGVDNIDSCAPAFKATNAGDLAIPVGVINAGEIGQLIWGEEPTIHKYFPINEFVELLLGFFLVDGEGNDPIRVEFGAQPVG